MESLARFPQLTWLDLSNTEVTNSGLVHVKDLLQLRCLSVLVQQITDDRERELKQDMRYLTIEKLWDIDGRKVVDGFQK